MSVILIRTSAMEVDDSTKGRSRGEEESIFLDIIIPLQSCRTYPVNSLTNP